MNSVDEFKGDEIRGLLRTELSAVETYERAVGERAWDLLRGKHAQHLINILVDHLEVSSELQAIIQQTTSPLVDGVEKRETWFILGIQASKLFGEAKLFSDAATIQALKKGEENALEAYQTILEDPATPTPMKAFVNSLVMRQRAHIHALEGLLENYRNHPRLQ